MAKRTGTAVLAAISMLLAACASTPASDPSTSLGDDRRTATVSPSVDTDAVSAATGDATQQVVLQRLAENPDANVVLSPAGLQTTMAMVAPGVEEGSPEAAELEAFLGTPIADTTAGYRMLIDNQEAKSDDDTEVRIETAWGIVEGSSVPIDIDVVGTAAQTLDSYVAQGTPDVLQPALDAWVSDATKDLVPELPAQINSDASLVLVSALYTEATWLNDAGETTIAFTRADGSTEDADAIVLEGQAYETEEGTVAALSLSGDLVFQVYMPADGSLGETESVPWELLDQDGDLSRTVKVPEFSLDSTDSLEEELETLGLGSLTSGEGITGFTTTGDPIKPQMIEQRTVFDLDDEGIEAASVTQVPLEAGADPGAATTAQPPVVFDHPFVFRVIDEESGWVLYFGAVVNPEDD